MQTLITGAAGFIGFHICRALLQQGHQVTGIDNLNTYYPVELKMDRLNLLQEFPQFQFYHADIFERDMLFEIFRTAQPDRVIHLAAQAGVRYSLKNPHSYVDSNLVGFVNILEACRINQSDHLVFASSSSVYGANKKVPFSIKDAVDKPVNLYAATKRANELIAYTYSHLYNIPCTGLRFFTVYGPLGRPDMAYFTFTKAILEGAPIQVYNHGHMKRDFTYIDDIVKGVLSVSELIPKGNDEDKTPWQLFNIGNNKPVELNYFIEILEYLTGKKAIKEYLPIQPGDVPQTYADIDDLTQATGFAPSTTIEEGLQKFVVWFRGYYHSNIEL
jgi:UDP-glucuronate 4-epimerase